MSLTEQPILDLAWSRLVAMCLINLHGKILIDITVPLNPSNVRRVLLPPGRAAAIEAQAILGSLTRVVATLHHVSATHLAAKEQTIPSDVLVCGDDDDAHVRS